MLGIEPTTSRVLLCSWVLYCCATTLAQVEITQNDSVTPRGERFKDNLIAH